MILNEGQSQGLRILTKERDNAFLTGQAGVGKTTLVRTFLNGQNSRRFPVIASTGMAAILAGGRTAHSAFGLGVMHGGPHATIKRAIENPKVVSRMNYWKGILIDEISMIDAPTFATMEHIARRARKNELPWGGLRVITVGDFAQLPPVSKTRDKLWAFKSDVWTRSKFRNIMLTEVMRTQNDDFIKILNYVRRGVVNEEVEAFLDGHIIQDEENFVGTRLFGKKVSVEQYNLEKLASLPGKERVFDTEYMGPDYAIEKLKTRIPINDTIVLKEGALVMLRTNDPNGAYVNGSLGWVEVINGSFDMQIRLMSTNENVWIQKFTFEEKDGDGHPLATATNYPVSLAYAMTIHKTQGATLDRVLINANDFWEAGQCYVALSRVKSPDGLFIKAWEPSSILADREVMAFYDKLLEEQCKAGNSSSAQLNLTCSPE